jgi:putative DNA primase/helicase
MMDVRTLAAASRGDVDGRNQARCPGPGHSPHDRSLSVRLDPGAPEGFLCHSFSTDDWRECRDHVRRALGLARRERAPRSAAPRQSRTTTTDALALWQRSTDPHGTVVETYLRSRHLELPDGDAIIRHHPHIGLHGEPGAIMVALMRDVVTDRPVAVHRTFVDHTGRKTGRKMMGPCGGAAIKLAPPTNVLVVAEGIETALAATAAGMAPVWAMGSAGAIGALAVLPTVDRLVILAEIDGGASRDAIASCSHRWNGTAGKKVIVITPTVGKDFADVWAHTGNPWRDHVDIKRMWP